MPRIRANGIEMHYHVQGKGLPIVFLHPPCIGSRIFTYLSNDLSQDHKSLLFDMRGHGQSGTSGERLTIPLIAQDTCRLMDALDIPSAYLCAYSVATMAALEALHAHPERFRGAILMGGAAQVTGWKTRAKLRLGRIAGRWRLKELLSLPILWSNSDRIETFRRLRKETTAGDVAKWAEYLEGARQYSAVGYLAEIRQPVLLLCGEKDREFKTYMKILQKGLPLASIAYVPGVKHTLPTHAAHEVAPIIREWIKALEGEGPTEVKQGLPSFEVAPLVQTDDSEQPKYE
ncbi:alpha/beta fold hydrolase [Cohnella sp. CFH 77786]|uniref:alpha/beta fold hydrolase n=1 Tax=Cohnella sp. CFH 77786 TaxID=2662265 RepID=UPI001C60DE65|nr:alpha/beta hydrolase [Cohnella sp. CFH 77786]MBW5447294.1 alpha/beta fold hydrolase [Cohnella sp. CFH 77786]